MTYSVKEIFYTLQGEGAQAGSPAVFCRFAGCNLWSGLESDRAGAVCRFCDTDFVGTNGTQGGKFPRAEVLAGDIAACWPAGDSASHRPDGERARVRPDGESAPFRPDGESAPFRPDGESAPFRPDGRGQRLVVLTGGEPLLQVDAALIDALHRFGFRIAVETNGTLPAPPGLDWICVSPKHGAPLNQRSGNELKVVVPQPGLDLQALAGLAFEHRFVQPMDGPERERNTRHAIELCMADPRWRLSVQTHKMIGLR